MANDVSALTKEWIKYLKNSRIAAMQSDPETGKLNYKRKVTTDDVAQFLELKTDYDNEQISNAIHMVLARKATGTWPSKLQNNPSDKKPGTSLSTWSHNEVRPGEKNNSQAPQQAVDIGPTRIKHDPNSISDIDYKEIPNDPNDRTRTKRKSRVKEAFVDEEGYTLSEEEVEAIFSILAKSGKTPDEQPVDDQPEQPEEPEQPDPESKIRDLNRLKSLIRDRMTDAQRQALWRALTDA